MVKKNRNPRILPSPEWLRDRLEYRDGGLFWKRRPLEDFASRRTHKGWNTSFAGKRAGSPMSNGYRMVAILGTKFLEHRIIFHMEVRAIQPGETVDHEDQDHTRNDPGNVRACTHAQNLMNQPGRRPGSSLPKHVYWSALEKRYKVQMRANGKVHFIGTFTDLTEASFAASEARSRLHGEFADNRVSK